MSTLFQPKLIVIGISEYGPAYRDALTGLFFNLIIQTFKDISTLEAQRTIEEFYQESIRQIFDCMDPDFYIFSLNINSRPEIERFIKNDLFLGSQEIWIKFASYWKEMAVGVYFAIKEQNLLFPNTVYILDHPGPDFITCNIYPK